MTIGRCRLPLLRWVVESIIEDRKCCRCLSALWIIEQKKKKSYFHYNRSIPQRGHEVRWTLTPGIVAHTDDTPRAGPGCQGDVTPPFQRGSHFGARVSVTLIVLGRKVGLAGERDNTWFSVTALGRDCLKDKVQRPCQCMCAKVCECVLCSYLKLKL